MFGIEGDLRVWLPVQLVNVRHNGYSDMFRNVTWYEGLVTVDDGTQRMFFASIPASHGTHYLPEIDAGGRPIRRSSILHPYVSVSTGAPCIGLSSIVCVNPVNGEKAYLIAHDPVDPNISLDEWFEDREVEFRAKFPNNSMA